jgi:hypothetical protein
MVWVADRLTLVFIAVFVALTVLNMATGFSRGPHPCCVLKWSIVFKRRPALEPSEAPCALRAIAISGRAMCWPAARPLGVKQKVAPVRPEKPRADGAVVPGLDCGQRDPTPASGLGADWQTSLCSDHRRARCAGLDPPAQDRERRLPGPPLSSIRPVRSRPLCVKGAAGSFRIVVGCASSVSMQNTLPH